MAHLNCPTCYQGMWTDQWGNMCENQCSGSNLSLNMGPGGYPMNPMWMGTWHGPPPSAMGMYPYPVGLPPPCHMHHDSQTLSRAGSPPHSIKSRKSYLSKTSRRKYHDHEDSEEDFDDRRSIRSERKSINTRPRASRDTNSMPREIRRRVPQERTERASITRGRHSIRATSSSEDENLKDVEMAEDDGNPIKIEDFMEKTPEEAAPTPLAKWECEHCTFVNEAGTRVCLICCKTPTTTAVKLISGSPKSEKKEPKKGVVRRNSKNLELVALPASRSSDDYSKDQSETESVLNKFGKQVSLMDTSEEVESKNVEEVEDRKKGRTSRKISFWPGTKFAPIQNK